jgi:thiol-disulfide isomerase/thioredoxin
LHQWIKFVSKTFIVPFWAKVAFFFGSISLLASLIGFQIYKRSRYVQLRAETHMAPEAFAFDGDLNPALAQFKGKWILLHFWATWCPPCRAEMPKLDRLSQQLKSKLVVVTMSEDENINDVTKFFNRQKPAFEVLLDNKQELAKRLGLQRYPESFLVSPAGKIIWRFSGPREWDQAVSYLSQFLDV